MRVALKSIKGVDRVTVSLNAGQATIELAANNSVTTRQLEDALARNGFTSKESRVVVAGEVVLRGDKMVLRISGSNEEVPLKSAADNAGSLKDFAGKSVVVTGSFTVVQMAKPPEELRVDSIAEAK